MYKKFIFNGKALCSIGDCSQASLKLLKLRMLKIKKYNQTVGDKIHCQKGNSPDYKLRSLNNN